MLFELLNCGFNPCGNTFCDTLLFQIQEVAKHLSWSLQKKGESMLSLSSLCPEACQKTSIHFVLYMHAHISLIQHHRHTNILSKNTMYNSGEPSGSSRYSVFLQILSN